MPVLKRPKKTSGTKIVRAEFSMGRAPRRVSDFEITVDHMGRKSLKAHAPPKDHTGKLRGIMIALAVLIILAAAFVFVLVYTEFKEAAKSPPGSAQEVIGGGRPEQVSAAGGTAQRAGCRLCARVDGI